MKLPVVCQLIPPSIEYSTVPPVAVTVIEPSSTPQLLGLLELTFEIFVGVGPFRVTFATL